MANSEDVLERAERLIRHGGSAEEWVYTATDLAAEVRELRADLEWSIRRGMPRIRRENMSQVVVGPAEGPLRWIDFGGTEGGLLSAVRRAREGTE